MSMSEQDKYWHGRYESLSPRNQGAIHAAFSATNCIFQEHGVKTKMDDRAEQLIAALTRYMICSDHA